MATPEGTTGEDARFILLWFWVRSSGFEVSGLGFFRILPDSDFAVRHRSRFADTPTRVSRRLRAS
jgi:hypothetical protein